jgi:hypothetical protein
MADQNDMQKGAIRDFMGIEPGDDEAERVRVIRELFRVARNQRRARVETWRKNYRVLHNRTWAAGRDSWLPTPTASETWPIVASMIGWMTDQRPMLYVVPAADPHQPTYEQTFSPIAHDLEKTLEATWHKHNTDAEHEKILWDAHAFGTGLGKTTWDAALDEGLGDAVTVRVDPFRFYPDPTATNEYDGNFYIEARTMSLQELDRRYPGASDLPGLVEENTMVDERPDLYSDTNRTPRANPGPISPNTSQQYGRPSWRRESGGDTYDRAVTVYEAWVREHDLWVDASVDPPEDRIDDRWHVYIMCGERIIFDAEAHDLWGHGRHPYTRYVLTDEGEFWGTSIVEHLASNQIAMNRLLAAMQLHAELTGNPILLESTRSRLGRAKITNKPGGRYTIPPGTKADTGWLDPPSMAAEVQNLILFHREEMERISGMSAMSRGTAPQGRPAKKMIDNIQEASFVRVRMALRNLEKFLRDSGELRAALIAENYTVERIVAINGPSGQKTAMALKGRHFFTPQETIGEDGKVKLESMPLRFSLWIQAGSSLPTSRQARAQEADVLYGMQAIDRQAVLEAHDYPNRQEIIKRMDQKEMMAQMAQAQSKGGPKARNRPRQGPGQ